MKKLLLFVSLLFMLGCSDQPKKIVTEDHSVLLNGKIKCEIYYETDMFTRIKTDTIIEEEHFQLIADTLKAKNGIVYFNIPELLGRGEEYGSLISGMPLVFDDFDKEKLLKEKAIKEKEAIEKARREGRRDDDFAKKAFIMSQEIVKQKLLSPKSADFPFLDYQSSNVIDNTIVIRSYVDAKNAYGTEIRHNYSIKMKKVGNDWSEPSSWTVISLDFD